MINNSHNNKCLHCDQCKKTTVTRKNRKGKTVEYTYCKGAEEINNITNWLYRSQAGYLASTVKINTDNIEPKVLEKYPVLNEYDGKYMYFTRPFADDQNKQIDHIDGDRANNCLDNLFECTIEQNTQNRHDRTGCYFNNVRKNKDNSYTAYKINKGKFVNIGNFDTDIQAYDAFIKYCRIHQIGINPNTLCYNTYTAVKSTSSIYNNGLTFTGDVYYGESL